MASWQNVPSKRRAQKDDLSCAWPVRDRGGAVGPRSVYEARRGSRTRMGRKEPHRQFVRPRACAERLVLIWPLEWLNRLPIGTAAAAAKDAGAALVPCGLQDHPRRQRATRISGVRRELCHVAVPAFVLLQVLAEGRAYSHAAESLAYAENVGRSGAPDPVGDGAHCADVERGASHVVSQPRPHSSARSVSVPVPSSVHAVHEAVPKCRNKFAQQPTVTAGCGPNSHQKGIKTELFHFAPLRWGIR